MSNDYVAKVVLRTPLPRSRRQRGQGVVGSAVASIVPDGVTDHAQLSGRYDPGAHPLNAITGLAEFKGLFDSMFERVNLGTDAAPVYAIKAKLDLFSVGGITAYGEGQGGGGGGVSNLYQLSDVPDYRTSYRGKILKSKSDGSGVEWVDVPNSAVWGNIGGTLSAQTDLVNALAGKAALSHTHTKSQITDFAHTHSISDVTGLQTALDGKQATISDLTTIRSNAANGNTAYGWGNHALQGYLTAITKTMVENILTGNIASHTHSYLPLSGGTMTGAIGFGGSVTVSRDEQHDALKVHTYHADSWFGAQNTSFCHIYTTASGFYFNKADLYANGARIYHSDNLTNLSQLTDNLGSNPVHMHSQYLTSAVAATTYHPLYGSTALALSASSLTLAGAISGATNITASGTGTMKEIVLSNNGHTVKIELDASGNLKINGNVFATGAVTAYQTN